jgi:hypothetical protein
MKKIYVIAGTFDQFVDWCRENMVSKNSPLVCYIPEGQGREILSGTMNPEIVCQGTFRQRRDFFELEALVRDCTKPQTEIVYVEVPEKPKPVKFVEEFTRKIAWRVRTVPSIA